MGFNYSRINSGSIPQGNVSILVPFTFVFVKDFDPQAGEKKKEKKETKKKREMEALKPNFQFTNQICDIYSDVITNKVN